MNNDSVLNSVKKLLGIPKESVSFDQDILMNINAAIFTLTQIGVVSKDGYVVDENSTYHDFLNDEGIIQQVKMYLYYKTRIGFDPPTNVSVLQTLQEMIQEAEWRLKSQVDPAMIFDEE